MGPSAHGPRRTHAASMCPSRTAGGRMQDTPTPPRVGGKRKGQLQPDYVVPNRGGDADAGGSTAATVRVTVGNFRRAESDRRLKAIAQDDGGFGKFAHQQQFPSIESRDVVRPSRDTLSSVAVFDLDAAPATLSLPPSLRYMALQVIDEDQYTHAVIHSAGSYTWAKDIVGTRYVLVTVRTFADANDANDLEQARALQSRIGILQRAPGLFAVPNWDLAGLQRLRDALAILGETLPDTKRMFGLRSQIDPVRHLIGTAIAW